MRVRVHSGGPKCMVGSTVFEMWLGALGSSVSQPLLGGRASSGGLEPSLDALCSFIIKPREQRSDFPAFDLCKRMIFQKVYIWNYYNARKS